jgi:hypothetical protein
VRADVFAAVSLGALLAGGCATTAPPAAAAPAAIPASAAEASNGEAPNPPSSEVQPADAPASPAPPVKCAARVGADGLRRSALKRTVDAGLGRWLQTVSVDPLLARGQFRGWIIRSFNSDDACLAGVDLRAGDVVTRVNGRGVEHPEEALEVWTKLPSSSELVIDFLRDGQARKVRFGIVDP